MPFAPISLCSMSQSSNMFDTAQLLELNNLTSKFHSASLTEHTTNMPLNQLPTLNAADQRCAHKWSQINGGNTMGSFEQKMSSQVSQVAHSHISKGL